MLTTRRYPLCCEVPTRILGVDAMKAVVATTTYATHKTHAERVRANCALKTIESSVAHGYTTVVIDGGSPSEYVDEMKRLGANVFVQELPGMGNARREALCRARDIASNGQPIVWTEPEKYPLIPELRVPLSTLTEGNYDLVMLRRTSLTSYPPEQAMAYKLIALAVKYLIGIDSDFGWGPTVLSRDAVEYYLRYESMYGDMWDGIHCPKLHIINDGLPWTIMPVNYQHPPEQTAAETGMGLFHKRIKQVDQLVRAIEQEVDRLGMRVE